MTVAVVQPIHVATEGWLDDSIGVATRGWIVIAVAPPVPPIIVVPWIEPVTWIGEYDNEQYWTGEWDPDP